MVDHLSRDQFLRVLYFTGKYILKFLQVCQSFCHLSNSFPFNFKILSPHSKFFTSYFPFRAYRPFHMLQCNLPRFLLIAVQISLRLSNTGTWPLSALLRCQPRSHPISLRKPTPDPRTLRSFWSQPALPCPLMPPLWRSPLRTCHSMLSVPMTSRYTVHRFIIVYVLLIPPPPLCPLTRDCSVKCSNEISTLHSTFQGSNTQIGFAQAPLVGATTVQGMRK
jgi:hypothetical protein